MALRYGPMTQMAHDQGRCVPNCGYCVFRSPEQLVSNPLNDLIIKEVHSPDGEQPRVILYQVKQALNALIRAHNALVQHIGSVPLVAQAIMEAYDDGRFVLLKNPMSETITIPARVGMEKNKHEDVIGLLLSMQYFCTCVAPKVSESRAVLYRCFVYHWCDACNRLIPHEDD